MKTTKEFLHQHHRTKILKQIQKQLPKHLTTKIIQHSHFQDYTKYLQITTDHPKNAQIEIDIPNNQELTLKDRYQQYGTNVTTYQLANPNLFQQIQNQIQQILDQ